MLLNGLIKGLIVLYNYTYFAHASFYVFYIFKTEAHQLQAGTPGFLKLLMCGRLYVCVPAPKAINT